jgi:Zn-dependent protease
MRYLIYATIAFLALRALQSALLWLQLRQARFRAGPRAEVVEPDALPRELDPLFTEASNQLAALGFEPSHAQWTDAMVTAEPRRPVRVFLHPPTCTFADVSPPIFQNGRRLFSVTFTTYFRSGHILTTVDSLLHLTPLRPADMELRDDAVNDVALQWQSHAHAVHERALTDGPVPMTAAEYSERQNRSLAAVVEYGRQQGVLEAPAHAAYRLTRIAAWRAARAALTGARALARRERTALDGSVDAWLAADEYAFRHAERQPVLPLSTTAKVRLFVASVLLSVIALGFVVSWSLVPAVLIVLMLHELGHMGGMWLFGYRDRQIVFLPFIGAAAFGRKHDASPLERVIVLLLGPVPGILLGFLCVSLASATGAAWLQEFGLTALVLNYLNLLPFTPLDGGRILEVLLLQRFPRAGAAFLLTSAVAAGIAGIAAGDAFLVLISVALFCALPGRWIVARAAAETRRSLPGYAARSDRIRAAFRSLDARSKPVASSARIPFARAIVEQLDAPYAPAPLVLGGAVLYGFLLIAPVAVTALVLIPNPTIADLCVAVEVREPHPFSPHYGDALADVCAEPGFPELQGAAQWKMLVDRGGTHLATGDSALATQYYRLADDAAGLEFDDDDPRRIATRGLVDELVVAEKARAAVAAMDALLDPGK